MFVDNNYTPVVITLDPNIGEAGKATAYVRKFNPAIDTDPLRPGHPLHRDLQPLRAPRLPRPLGRRGRALHLPLPRRRLRPARPAASAVRPSARWTASTRGSSAKTSSSGPASPSTAQLRRFSPRDPGEPLDGIGQYLYPSRPGAQKLSRSEELAPATQSSCPSHMPKLPAPPVPPALKPPPQRPGEDTGEKGVVHGAKEAGITVIDWVDERTSLERRRPLADVPQGAQGHELVLHARLGHPCSRSYRRP